MTVEVSNRSSTESEEAAAHCVALFDALATAGLLETRIDRIEERARIVAEALAVGGGTEPTELSAPLLVISYARDAERLATNSFFEFNSGDLAEILGHLNGALEDLSLRFEIVEVGDNGQSVELLTREGSPHVASGREIFEWGQVGFTLVEALDRMLERGKVPRRIYRFPEVDEVSDFDLDLKPDDERPQRSYAALLPQSARTLRFWFSAFARTAWSVLQAVDQGFDVKKLDPELIKERLQTGIREQDADALVRLLEELEEQSEHCDAELANHVVAAVLEVSTRWSDADEEADMFEALLACTSRGRFAASRRNVEEGILTSKAVSLEERRARLRASREAVDVARARSEALRATPGPSTPEEVIDWVARGLDGEPTAIDVVDRLISKGAGPMQQLYRATVRAQLMTRARAGHSADPLDESFHSGNAFNLFEWRDEPEASSPETRAAFAARGPLARRIVESWDIADRHDATQRWFDEQRLRREQRLAQREREGPPPETLASFPVQIRNLVINGDLDNATRLFFSHYQGRVTEERAREIIEAARQGFEPF